MDCYRLIFFGAIKLKRVDQRGEMRMKKGSGKNVKKYLLIGLIFVSGFLLGESFSGRSLPDMKLALQDVELSLKVYGDSDNVTKGFKPSDAFLKSSHVVKLGFDSKGNQVFAFKSDDQQTSGMMVYDKANGMISPYVSKNSDVSAFERSLQFPTPDAAYVGIIDRKLPNFHAQELTSANANKMAMSTPALFLQEPPNFHAQVLISADGELHIAFRGTVTFDDWGENGSARLGNIPSQYRVADMLSMAMSDTTSRKVNYTGHSEGAGEMQYVILKNLERGNANIKGTGYNSQRFSNEILDSFKPDIIEKAGGMITQIRSQTDVVSGSKILGDSLLGSVFELSTIGPVRRVWGWMNPVVFVKNMLDSHSVSLLKEAINTEIQKKENSLIQTDISCRLPGVTTPDESGSTGSGAKQPKKPVSLNRMEM